VNRQLILAAINAKLERLDQRQLEAIHNCLCWAPGVIDAVADSLDAVFDDLCHDVSHSFNPK
jgi:hypothetical protein